VKDYFLEVRNDNNRIVMTHEMLKQLLSEEEKLDVFRGFDVIAIDELYRLFDNYTRTVASIRPMTISLMDIEGSSEDVEQVCNFIQWLNFQSNKQREEGKKGVRVVNVEHLENVAFSTLIDKVDKLRGEITKQSKKDVIGFLEVLKEAKGNVFYMERIDTGVVFTAVKNLFPTTRSILLLADGATRDGMTQALQKYGHLHNVDPVVPYIPRGDWSNYSIDYETVSTTGVNSLSKKIKDVSKVLRNSPLGLVVGHMNDIEQLEKENLHHKLIHWGAHKSRNDLSEYDTLYVLSLFYKPFTENSSRVMGLSNPYVYKTGDYEAMNVPATSAYLDLIQVIGRMNRGLDDSRQLKVKFVVMERDKDFLLQWLSEDTPKSNLNEAIWLGINVTDAKKVLGYAAGIAESFYETRSDAGICIPLSELSDDGKKFTDQLRSKTFEKAFHKQLDHFNLVMERYDGVMNKGRRKGIAKGRTLVVRSV